MPGTIEQIYDFETALELGTKAALESVEFDVDAHLYTTSSEPELQRVRPRVDIEFFTAGATEHRRVSSDAVYVPDAFTGTVQFTIVTNSADGEEEGVGNGMADHAGLRARLRYYLDRIETTFTVDAAGDDTLLPYHSVNRFFPAGSTPTMKNEDGYIESRLAYDVHFNIRPDAWPE